MCVCVCVWLYRNQQKQNILLRTNNKTVGLMELVAIQSGSYKGL